MSHQRQLSSNRAIEEAKYDNLTVVFPAHNQLQIDIDNAADYAIFKAHLEIIRDRLGIKFIEEHPSRSGGFRKHITITLSASVLSHAERILLQAVLGSDRMREMLNYFQSLLRDRFPVLFLENPHMVKMLGIKFRTPISHQLNPANKAIAYLKEQLP
jgi:hypothetical protein